MYLPGIENKGNGIVHQLQQYRAGTRPLDPAENILNRQFHAAAPDE